MFTELYWIPGPWAGRLAISARPRGGDWLEDEMRGWRNEGIDVVVSLLEPDEAADLELQEEPQQVAAHGIEFVSFPIPDRSVPTSDVDAERLVSRLDATLARGKSMVIHCRQGIGRSGLIAAGLLIGRGVGAEMAVKRVSTSRGKQVPETAEQERWLHRWAEREGGAIAS